jgi:hypothetical protein
VPITFPPKFLNSLTSTRQGKCLRPDLALVKKDSEIKRIRGGGQTGKRNGIHMPDGSIWTGFYSDWEQLSKTDRKTVMDTCTSTSEGGFC